MTEPCDFDARTARQLIGSKRLSATELLESCLARIAAVNPAVNAMVAMDEAAARMQAKSADAAVAQGRDLGALHGLPVGIKDLEDAAGLPTTFGSTIFRDNRPARDQRSVAALRAAGAVILGKTNTPEFGAGANTRNAVYGATGNPFNPAYSAAGSSGGSAVALACGMVPLASGSDTGGSLRNPASFCGIVGFRPTPGLVPSESRLHGWSPLAVLGPMARTVRDAGLMLSVMAAHDSLDPLSCPVDAASFAALPETDLSTVRAAFSPDLGFAPTERLVSTAFHDKTALFRNVFARSEDAAPDCSGTDEAFEILRATTFLASHGERVRTRPNDVGPNVRANVEEGLRYSAQDVARALSLQTALYRRWQTFFETRDVLITPSITISPRLWTELYPAEIDGHPTRTYFHWLALAYAVTVVGHPAISLPVGVDARGMPFGLQIIGRRGGDRAVLGVAAAIESLLAGDPRTARPIANIGRLAGSPAIAGMAEFLTV